MCIFRIIARIHNDCITSGASNTLKLQDVVTDLFPACSVELFVLYKEVFNITSFIFPLHLHSQMP